MKFFNKTPLFLLAFSLVLLASCNPVNDEDIPGDNLNFIYTDTLSLEASLMRDDTLRGDGQTYVTMGAYRDPIFGVVNAGFYTSFGSALPSMVLAAFNNIVVDSVTLTMQFVGSYSNANKLKGYLEFDVHEVTEKIEVPAEGSQGYSTGKRFNMNPTPIGSFNTSPIVQPLSAGVFAIRTKLDNAIGTRLMTLDTLTHDKVQNEFKGIYVGVKPSFAQSMPDGYGSVLYMNLANSTSTVSKLSVHIGYTPPGSSSQVKVEVWLSPSIVGRTVRVNSFSHDYANTASADFNTKLNNPADTTVKNLYLQAGNGVRTLIKIPHIANLVSSDSTVVLNKAELIIPVEENSGADLFLPPQQLYAYIYNTEASGSTNTANWIQDYSNSWFKGTYDASLKQYSVVITKYLNKVATGRLPNNGFFIDVAPAAKATSVNRVVINGPNHPTRPMKIAVTYTRVKI